MTQSDGEKLISSNPTARSEYEWVEVVEAGLALTGTEIKSIRSSAPQIKDAHVDISGYHGRLEAWLLGANIQPYSHGNIWNHEPLRRRKLLLHKHQISQMFGAITQKGMTIVPTRMYFKRGRVKIELAVAKGKKTIDKREDIKRRTAEREMDAAMKSARRSRS